jgi:hypothetical protein
LNRHYTSEKIRRFVVLSGALDGWRQPQEFMLLSQTAPFIDGFITLEGWNESRAVFQRQSRFSFELPDGIYYLAMAGHFGGATANLAYQLDANVKKWQRETGWLQRSHFLYFISQRMRNIFLGWAVRGTISINKIAQDYYQNTHQLPSAWTKEQRTDFIWNAYKKYMRSSYVVAKSMDVKTLFLIQPSPAYGKMLTPEELKVAGDLTYGEVYVQMEQKLLELRKEGVGVYSLLNIFEKHPDTDYKRFAE